MSNRKYLDPSEFSGIRWWLKKRRRYYFQNVLTLAIFLGFFGPLFAQVPLDSLSRTDLLLIAPIALMLVFFTGYQLWQWIRSFNLKIHECQMGTIIDMYRVAKRRKNTRSYRIIADVNGKELEGYCNLRTYRMAQKGQKILLFSLGGDKLFCVHPEM